MIEDSTKSLADTYYNIGLILEKSDLLLGYHFISKAYEIK